MTFETLAGRKARVMRTGSGSEAVVGIHCSLGRLETLLPVVKAMGGTVQATLFDLPGHGSSEAWDDSAEYQLVAAKQALELCDGPTHLIGHSFGGTVALRAALEEPSKVKRLTLIEPVFFAAAKGTPAYAQHHASFEPFAKAWAAQDRALAAQVFNDMWGVAPWSQLPEAVRNGLTSLIHLIPVAAPSIEDDITGVLASGALEALDIPVTLICGSQSPPIVRAIHEALCERLPNATDHVVEGAAHMLPVTHPDAVASAMMAAA